MRGDEYASLGLGLGDGNGDDLSDGGKPGARGGVPPSDGVGVPTRGNCHGAGDARRMIVWLLRIGGDEAGELLVRCRQRTSRTSLSSVLPSRSVLLEIRAEMRSAWSSSRMFSSFRRVEWRLAVIRNGHHSILDAYLEG